MDKTWNQCIKVYEAGEFLDFDEAEHKISFDKVFIEFNAYSTRIGYEPEKTVWYDLIEEICFGPEQTFYKNPADFSFFCSEEVFLTEKNTFWGKEKMTTQFSNIFGEQNFSYSECGQAFGSPSIDYNKYKGKSILVLGAGPSALKGGWKDKVEECDFVWSCNNYLNFYDLQKKIDLAFIGPTVEIGEEFLSRISEDKTTIFLEGGVTPYRDEKSVKDLKEKIQNQLKWIHFRYFSKLGAAARLLVFANMVGAKNVYFVGLDGDPTGQKHAFEKDKNLNKESSNLKYNLFRRQYVLLWEYIKNNYPSTKNINLGEGHLSNLSTGIV